ncbi:MAG: fibrobacter succinogenes major paralogous domain-containing protein [Bacteroidales bacterium]|nr:fibrobacter succinogenes major paralogous domain-containing protein [Bacteroidales bacterium]
MRKLFMLGITLLISLVMLMSSCKKDEIKNRDNSGNSGSSTTGQVIPNAVRDKDGNCYDAVQIGDYVWMAENLRTTRFPDGEYIGVGADNIWSLPDGDINNVPVYGYLYDWNSVMYKAEECEGDPLHKIVQGVCPNGWHVPTVDDWGNFWNSVKGNSQNHCGGCQDNIAKALASTTGWDSTTVAYAPGNNQHTNNATGFSAYPAGCSGNYFGIECGFWSTKDDFSDFPDYQNNPDAYENQALIFCFRYDVAYAWMHPQSKDSRSSVRCVRDY